jgi:hypothetical protein
VSDIIADYRNELRELGTYITYQPVIITEGSSGEDVVSFGNNQVIPARVDEMGIESSLVKAGILEPGDYVVGIPGDETIPPAAQVICNNETCIVEKEGKRNLNIKKEIYLKKVRPDV